MSSFKLVCLGNPLLDLQADVTPEYLAKYNLKANDAILVEPLQMPIFTEVVEMEGVHTLAGGAAQNTARGAQYLLPENLVVYFGSVGTDKYAELLEAANAKYGLATRYQYQTEHETGKCAALITGHNRLLATDLAAANHFTPDHLEKPENWALVEGASFFYVGGFHLTVLPPAILKLAQHAAATNKVVALNLSAPFIPEFFKDALDLVLPYVDYVIANESEAEAYAKSHGLEGKLVAEVAAAIAALPKENTQRARTVVFTQGLDPTVVVLQSTTTEYPVHPLDASKIVDTNGAGDAFASGFMAALVEGKDLAQAVDLGQWAAALSIQQVGPSFPFPKVTRA